MNTRLEGRIVGPGTAQDQISDIEWLNTIR